MTKVFALWLAKEIARHSFTGLNIIIFHEGLFNISYCHYNQQEKLENNYKTSFWKSQHFFKKKRSYTNARTPLPLFVFVRFSVIPCPPPLNERTFWMRPLNWDVLNFILVIYSNDSQLTYSLIGSLAVARKVLWIRSVRPFVRKISWNWLFSFFLELNMVWGPHVVLCMTELDFLKITFLPPKSGK